MPQNPTGIAIAVNPSGAIGPVNRDTEGNMLVRSVDGEAGIVSTVLSVTQARQLDIGTGVLESVNNVSVTAMAALTVTQLASLATTSISGFYDSAAATALGVLTTTQIASLSATQIMALMPQNLGSLKPGMPYTHGLVVLPGANVGLGLPDMSIAFQSTDDEA